MLNVVKGDTSVSNKIVHSHALHAKDRSTFIHMEELTNSTFPSYSLIAGELQAFDTNCSSLNFSTNLNSFRNSITLATIKHPENNLYLTNCHHVRESYHLCEMKAGVSDFVVCIRIDDLMKYGKFEMAVNLNYWACLDPYFHMSAVCKGKSDFLFIDEDVMLFSCQAKDNTTVIVVLSLIFVIGAIVGLVIVGLLLYLIRKRYRNHHMDEMTELVDE